MSSFIILGYVLQILETGGLFALPHPWPAPKRPILNTVNIESCFSTIDNFLSVLKDLRKAKEMCYSFDDLYFLIWERLVNCIFYYENCLWFSCKLTLTRGVSTLAKIFSCEFCEVFKNSFFTEHSRVTTSTCQIFMMERFRKKS